MTTAAAGGLPVPRATRRRRGLAALRIGVLLGGFGAAVTLRVAVGGPGAAQSPAAGLVFAGCLLLLAAASGVRSPVNGRVLLTGVAAGALICAPVALGQLLALRPLHDAVGFWPWAAVVTVVATAEEVFLRGALYDAVTTGLRAGWVGEVGAVGVGAVAFGLLHVPLYGWHVLPLDLSVGVVLGGLRVTTGSWTAPAVAHVLADLGGWFLR